LERPRTLRIPGLEDVPEREASEIAVTLESAEVELLSLLDEAVPLAWLALQMRERQAYLRDSWLLRHITAIVKDSRPGSIFRKLTSM
jgi:hypothetical protein